VPARLPRDATQIASFSLAVAALLGIANNAHASGFDNIQVGSARSGPTTRDAAAIHYNPAQLGYLERPELYVSGGLIFGAVSYERQRRGQYQYEDNFDFSDPIDPNDINPDKTGQAPEIATNPVGPNLAVFYAMPVIEDRLTMGLGLYVPYAAIVNAPPDGPQRFANQSISLLSANATLSAAVRLHDIVSIGGGVSYVLSALSLSKVQDFGAIDSFADGLAGEPISQPNSFGSDAPSTVRELDVLARDIEVDNAISHNVTFNAGIALRPTDKLDLALAYQHGANLRLQGKFTLNMDDDFFTQDLASQGLMFEPIVQGDVVVRMRLPRRIIAGAGYQFAKRFRLDGMASWAFYNTFDTVQIQMSSPDLAQPALGLGEDVDQPLVRDWVGTLLTEFTGAFQATEKLGVTALLGYHMPASPDSTVDMGSPDGHRMVFGAGMRYAFGDRFALLADFEGQAIVPRIVTESDFDLANGRYNLFIGHFGVTAQFRFGGRAKVAAAPKAAEPAAAPAEPDADEVGEEPAPKSPEPSGPQPAGDPAAPPPPPPPPPN